MSSVACWNTCHQKLTHADMSCPHNDIQKHNVCQSRLGICEASLDLADPCWGTETVNQNDEVLTCYVTANQVMHTANQVIPHDLILAGLFQGNSRHADAITGDFKSALSNCYKTVFVIEHKI